MMVQAGISQYQRFVVNYDNSLSNGLSLANSVLASCEQDYLQLQGLFGGIPLFNDPSKNIYVICTINLVPGTGGGSNNGVQEINCYVGVSTDAVGLSSLVVAELSEIFMVKQNKGWILNWSNGEALSRVLATVLYPQIADRWCISNEWLNNGRHDWITIVEHTDLDLVSSGCGTLFLNYLAYQLNFSWNQIIFAGALPGNTLADTAANLGVQNALNDFKALLEQYFPSNQTIHLPNDNPFPLGMHVKIPHQWEAMWLWLVGSLADGPLWGIGPNGPVPVDPMVLELSVEVREARRAILSGIKTLQKVGHAIEGKNLVATRSKIAGEEKNHAGKAGNSTKQ